MMEQLKAKTTTRAPSLAETTGRMFSLRVEEALAAALERDPSRRTRKATAFTDALTACFR
ncbi:MAG TPA: hypothetical protein VIL20_15175 [Sandaracinaceae bacterium]